jgi:hypothetical protein
MANERALSQAGKREAAMREFDQAFTVFGGAFVAESHDHQLPQRKPAGPMAAVIVALLLGSVTAAGAITGLQNVRSGYGFSYSKAPGMMGIEVALY